MDVRFGVHAGLQHTSIAELQRALARASRTLGFDWISIWDHFYAADDDRRPALPRGDHVAHRARDVDHERVHVRFARVLRRLPAPGGARQRDRDARPARRRPHRARPRRRLAPERVRRLRHALRHRRASGCACSTSTSSACAACSRRTARLRRRVLHAARRAVRAEAGAGRACRSGSAAAARR